MNKPKDKMNRHHKRSMRVILMWIFLGIALPAAAQNINVKGIVYDENEEPLPGATVQVVGHPNLGTATNLDGEFTLNKVPGKGVLKISYVGYANQVVKVTGNPMSIHMKPDSQELTTVVVTALGISREEKSLGYARQSVNTESMETTRDPNMLNALSGKISGVNIINNGGPLSSTRVEIRGNNSLTGNNQPLYVIDGVPIMNDMGEVDDLDYGNAASSINPDDIENIEVLKGANAAALYGSDAANGVIIITTKKAQNKSGLGVTYSYNMQFIHLREYPQYQNIYGSVGYVNAGQRNGMNFPTSTAMRGYEYDPTNPYGIYSINWGNSDSRCWGMPMIGFDILGRNNEIRAYSPGNDAVRQMYHTSIQMTHNLSVDRKFNGGSVRFTYTGTDYNSMIKHYNDMVRHNFNLSTNLQPTKWLTVDINTTYQMEDVKNRDSKFGWRNVMSAVLDAPRDLTMDELLPYKKPNGEAYVRGNSYQNPFWLINEVQNGDNRGLFRGNITAIVKPIRQIQVRLRASMERQDKNGWRFDNMYSPKDLDGYYDNWSENSRTYNYEALAMYNDRFFRKLSINANVGASIYKYGYNKQSSQVNQLAAPDIKSLSNNASVLKGWQAHSAKEKQSVFGLVSVGYGGFYVDGTFRNDWSSALPKKNNSYFYWSTSASAVITDIFKGITTPWFSFAKIRGSIAHVGNDCGFDQLINGYVYGGLFQNDKGWYQGENSAKNINLKPEKTISKEVGAEVRFFNGRLKGDVTYYHKATTNQIIRTGVSSLSGYQSVMMNAGKVTNNGWELSISGSPVKVHDFEWEVLFNWSKNKSFVNSLPEGMDKLEIGSSGPIKSYCVPGMPYGVLYGKTYLRDENNKILCTITGDPKEDPELSYVGNVQAKWRGGFGNTFKWKGISLNIMFDFQKGGKFFSETAYNNAISGNTIESLQGRYEHFFSAFVLGEEDAERNGFLRPGESITSTSNYSEAYPDHNSKGIAPTDEMIYDPNDNGVPDEWKGKPVHGYIRPASYWLHNNSRDVKRFIYDASFLKLREVVIAYDFPQKWLRKSFIRNLRVSAVGRNLATLFSHVPQGLDPQATSTVGNAQGIERGFNLPSATYGFDIKISF